jgi:acyl carrier protein
MDETEAILATCFKSILPQLSLLEISNADPDSVDGWDSVATLTLFALIEEEFGVDLTIDDVRSNHSFQGILNYIRSKQQMTK